jgi:hypothetical protein
MDPVSGADVKVPCDRYAVPTKAVAGKLGGARPSSRLDDTASGGTRCEIVAAWPPALRRSRSSLSDHAVVRSRVLEDAGGLEVGSQAAGRPFRYPEG